MKIAYLVVAHRNPVLLGREFRALASDDADFFIHIDKKSDILEFTKEVGGIAHFLENRRPVYWAGFSIVHAVLDLIDAALNGPQKYDYFVLLGGSEYPLRSKAYIHEFLERHAGTEFIDMVKLPNLAAGKPISHITKFCVEPSTPLLSFAAKIMSRAGFLSRDYRKYLQGLEPFGGEMWWALTRGACEYIREFTRTQSKVVRFFYNVQVPDETFIQTVLGNSHFAKRVRRNLLFRDWSGGGSHPSLINDGHLAGFEAAKEIVLSDAFGSGEVLFARKFSDQTLPLIDRIEAMIVKKEKAGDGIAVL